MLFEIHTRYDPETVRALQDTISGSGQTGRQKRARRGVLIAGAVCLAAGAALAFGLDNVVLGLVLLVCGAMLLVTGAGFDGYVGRRREKEEKKGTGQSPRESVSAFEADCFTVRSEKGEKTYSYADCRRLLENGDHFILMVGDRRAVALSKAGFWTGDPDEFRSFLRDKCGKEWNA